MLNIGQRIELVRLERGLSKTEIWKGAGLSSGVYSQWLNGMALSGETLIKVAQILRVNPEWLATGKGAKEIASLVKNSFSKNARVGVTIEHYDAEGSMGSGIILKDQPGVISEWQVSEEWVRLNIKNYTSLDNLKMVTGFGDSMLGMFNSGDPLIIDIGVKNADRDSPYFFRVGNEGFIKRLQRVPGVGLRAISANKEYETWTITEDMDFEVFGIVLKSWQSNNYN